MQSVFPALIEETVGSWWPVGASQAAYRAVNEGGAVVCLYGPAGVGKSALLAIAKAQGVAVWDDLETSTEEMQVSLFHALQRVTAQGQGGPKEERIVVASRVPVAQLTGLKPDVKSRLLLGEHIEVGYPTEPELRALLAHWAAGRQLVLPGAVADYVLARADRSPKSLKDLLVKLDSLSLQEKRGITVALARLVLV